jgi:biotin synthase
MTCYQNLADRVLDGTPPTREEAFIILATPQDKLLDLVNAAYTIRSRYFGNTVRLQMLLNAKSGACQEDCHYCSQSTISDAPIDRYALLSPEKMMEGARRAAEAKAQRYCIVISGRSPLQSEITQISSAVRKIKDEIPIQICLSSVHLQHTHLSRSTQHAEACPSRRLGTVQWRDCRDGRTR